MQPIEYCLDTILIQLEKNWDNFNQRTFLNCESILTQVGFKNEYKKHEFFEGLIDKLIEDKNVEFIDTNQSNEKLKITYYQQNTIITVRGYYLIHNGGYKQQKINQDSERNNLKAQATATLRLTVVLAFAALPVGILALVDLYWKYGWFQSPFWWGIAILMIVLSSLIAYLVWKLLQRKQSRKQ